MIYLLGLGPFELEDSDLIDYALAQDIWVRVSQEVEEWQDPRTEEWRETVEHTCKLDAYTDRKVYLKTGTWYQTADRDGLYVVYIYGASDERPTGRLMMADWTN